MGSVKLSLGIFYLTASHALFGLTSVNLGTPWLCHIWGQAEMAQTCFADGGVLGFF